MQVRAMEYEEVPEGTENGEWKEGQDRGVDMWVIGGREACYSCSTELTTGTDGGQREHSRC